MADWVRACARARPLSLSLSLSLSLVVFVAGCVADLPSERSATSSGASTIAASPRIRAEERYLFDLEAQFPGFGGYGVDTFGVRRIWIGAADAAAGMAQAIEANEVARGVPRQPENLSRPTVTELAAFSVSVLARVRDFVSDNYLAPGVGVVSVDLDEAINRVAVGVLAEHEVAVRNSLEDDLLRLGLPFAAVSLHQRTAGQIDVSRAPAEASLALMRRQGVNQSLWTPAVPMLGGIREVHPGTSPHSCTIGLVVTRNGVPGVISSSHCSPTTYGLDYGYEAHNGINGHAYGFEAGDPIGHTCPGFGTDLCRYSDAAFYERYDSVAVRRGAIARTQSYTTAWGDTATRLLQQSNPFYAVTSVAQPGQVQTGLYLMKVGKTTGRTEGLVIGTCSDEWFSDGYVRRCSTIAKYYSEIGDSGGPVWFPSGGDGVMLVGTHIGSNQDLERSFSSLWHNVVGEIGGSIVAWTDITVAAPVVSVSFPSQMPSLSWGAVATNNAILPPTYRVYRWAYDTIAGWTEWQALVHTTQGLAFEDTAKFVDLCYGTSTPPSGVNYVKYQVTAESHGVTAGAATVACRTFGAF